MRGKRAAACLLTGVLGITAVAGCGTAEKNAELPPGAAKNEIIAYQPVEEGKMMITARTEYNGVPGNLESIIEGRFSEVDFVPRLHNSAAGNELENCLSNDDVEDMLFTWDIEGVRDQRLEENFVDLSSKSFTSNYYTTALNNCQYNGKLYYLPGPSKMQGIVYDKTLFEEYGWEMPTGLDEFIELCKRIRTEAGIQPADFTFKWPSALSTYMNAWSYDAVLAGNENYEWLQEYAEGKETMIGHMEPMFELFQTLLDAGIVTEDAFTREPGDRSTALYREHTTAMTNETQMAPQYAKEADSDHEYAMMPLWGSNNPDSDYISVENTYNIAVNKKLEEKGNEEKYDKVMEIVEWLSSAEGQKALIGESGMAVSNVKGAIQESNAFTENIEATIAKGHLVPLTYYSKREDSKAFYTVMHQGFWNFAKGTQTAVEVMEDCDAEIKLLLQEEKIPKEKEKVYGKAAESFTRLETGLYIADVFRETADTDIGLVLVGQSGFGLINRLYQGDLTETIIKGIGLDSYKGGDPDDNKLAVATMTGEEILAVLEASFRDDHENQEKFTCYVASGLQVEYAPWADKAETIVSVKNEDGSKFDKEKEYSVAYWKGSLGKKAGWNGKDAASVLTDVVPERLYEESFLELLAPVIQEAGEISPSAEGRLILRWDIR